MTEPDTTRRIIINVRQGRHSLLRKILAWLTAVLAAAACIGALILIIPVVGFLLAVVLIVALIIALILAVWGIFFGRRFLSEMRKWRVTFTSGQGQPRPRKKVKSKVHTDE